MSNDKYFAALEPDKTASILLTKANSWFGQMDMDGYLEKLRMMWAAYHGAYYTSSGDSHSINFSGEQGELVQIPVNHLSNIAQYMITMITSNRPAFEAKAVNTDYKSLVQTYLANGLLEYYMREKRLEEYLKVAVEHAIVLGSGYIKMEWNSTSGDIYDFNEETNVDIRQGDVEFSNLSPFDVIFDVNREDNKHDWVMCRSWKNRYDIIAKYPEHEDKILKLPSKNEMSFTVFGNPSINDTDLIAIYEFYHRRSESMEDGRYLLFLSDDITLLDSPMPYRTLPIYRMAPRNIMGTPFGYTPLFDILPIQDAVNSLYSTILTNQNAFGVQNILVPSNSDIDIEAISGGLNVIKTNFANGKPEALNLTQTPPEIFSFLKTLEQQMETISGMNSVVRGNPEASLKSGSALALVQSTAIQFISGLQQSYIQLIEDVGTGLINMLKDYASVPRIAMISGKNNRSKMREFTGDDLSSINRVIVDVGNPLSRTTAGRVEMASQLLQMGAIKTGQEYFTVINTGNLNAFVEKEQDQMFLIRSENENLIAGDPVKAIATDNHQLHIAEHQAVLNDPVLRFDANLVKRTLDHMQEHIELLRTTDPALLSLMGQQSLGPVAGSPPSPQQPQQMNQSQAVDPGQLSTGQVQQGMIPAADMPNLPSLPNLPQ